MGRQPDVAGLGAGTRPPAPEEADAEFWGASLRTANVLNGAVLCCNLVYFASTWSTRPNRPLLVTMTSVALLGLAVGLVAGSAGRELASSAQRVRVFQAWAVAGVVVLTAGIALDGLLSSPMVWLLPLGVLFCALVHRPVLVVEQSVLTLVAFVGLAVADDAFTERPAAVGLHIGYFVVVGYLGARAASSRWRYHHQIVELAGHVAAMADRDPLTGLANHRVFHERLREELAAAQRSGEPVALLLLDLDLFKLVNDEHGHLVGDAALRAVAGVLAGVARESDVAARVGGEEFAMVLRGTDAAGGAAVAERIRQAVAVAPAPVPITVSVGVAAAPADATAAEALFEAADRAMYQAKGSGRNRVVAAA